MLDRVVRGERPRAADQNSLIALANALGGPDGASAFGSVMGKLAAADTTFRLELFELHTATPIITYPASGDRTPYATNARRTLWNSGEEENYDWSAMPQERIYFPRALWYLENNQRRYYGLPRGRVGQECMCLWNSLSARWECIDKPQTAYIGKLNDDLEVGYSVPVSVWQRTTASEEDTGIDVDTVHDFMLAEYTASMRTGTRVTINYCEENGRWYIINASCS